MTLEAAVRVGVGELDLDVEIDVGAGEVAAVLGPNGAGKTTLLRALAGLVALDDGRVTLGGRVLEDARAGVRLPSRERGVGVMFSEGLLFPHLSALENVAFGPRSRGVRARAARARASDWLARVGLGDVASAMPGALSAGQAQRVALARALATEPAMLLLDEPLSALDVETRLAVRRELRRHLESFAGPCLLVTHEPLEAFALAQRVVVVEDGRVVQQGAVAEVARRPRSPWVARLVGLNLFRGRAAGGRVTVDGATLVAASATEGEVFAVVHPRAVALHRTRPGGSPRNVWRGTIIGLDLLGDRVRAQIDGALPVVAELTAGAVSELNLAAGGDVWAAVKATEVELYPV